MQIKTFVCKPCLFNTSDATQIQRPIDQSVQAVNPLLMAALRNREETGPISSKVGALKSSVKQMRKDKKEETKEAREVAKKDKEKRKALQKRKRLAMKAKPKRAAKKYHGNQHRIKRRPSQQQTKMY